MGYNDWSRAIRSGQFVQDCRERRRKQGYDPDTKPSHSWLEANGYSSIKNYAQRNGMTVDELLVDELGFEEPSYEFAFDDPRTRGHVYQFTQDIEDDEYDRWGESTLPSIKCHLKKIAEASRRAVGADNLVSIGNEPRGVANRQIRSILSELETMLGAGIYNYARTFDRLMTYLYDIGATEYNRMSFIMTNKNYTPIPERPNSDDVPSSAEVYIAITNASSTLKTGITLLAGAGVRPTHTTKKKREDCHLDAADPYITVGPDNKTGPTDRALVGGREFLRNYIEVITAEQTGDTVYLFPSDNGKKPYLSYSTFLNDLTEHCRNLDLTDSNGDAYTPKSFKQFYLNLLIDASMRFEAEHVDRATKFIGDQSPSVKKDSYSMEELERDHFRLYAEAKFSAAFSGEAVTIKEIRKARASFARDEAQTGLSEFV